MKPPAQIVLIVLAGILGGILTFWAIQNDEAREFDSLKEKAFCTVELPAGIPSVSTVFSTTQTLERFHVGIRPGKKRESLTLELSDKEGLICRVSGVTGYFGCGQNIPSGTYTITMYQEAGGHGAMAVVAAEKPIYVTGHQIISRIYVSVLILAGIWALLVQRFKNQRIKIVSISVFQMLLLGFVLVFVYLLFHEGGHALGELAFGRFDLSRSDFWGIHGTPHSAGAPGPALESWQQAVISGGGPLLPTFAGWALFLFWISSTGQNLRARRPMVNLYLSAITAMLVFPQIIVDPLLLLGVIPGDGDWYGFINHVPGPLWIIKGLLWMTVLLSIFVLWRVMPEVFKYWKEKIGKYRGNVNINHRVTENGSV